MRIMLITQCTKAKMAFYAVFRTKYDGKELSSYEAKSGFYVNTIKTISSKLFL